MEKKIFLKNSNYKIHSYLKKRWLLIFCSSILSNKFNKMTNLWWIIMHHFMLNIKVIMLQISKQINNNTLKINLKISRYIHISTSNNSIIFLCKDHLELMSRTSIIFLNKWYNQNLQITIFKMACISPQNLIYKITTTQLCHLTI